MRHTHYAPSQASLNTKYQTTHQSAAPDNKLTTVEQKSSPKCSNGLRRGACSLTRMARDTAAQHSSSSRHASHQEVPGPPLALSRVYNQELRAAGERRIEKLNSVQLVSTVVATTAAAIAAAAVAAPSPPRAPRAAIVRLASPPLPASPTPAAQRQRKRSLSARLHLRKPRDRGAHSSAAAAHRTRGAVPHTHRSRLRASSGALAQPHGDALRARARSAQCERRAPRHTLTCEPRPCVHGAPYCQFNPPPPTVRRRPALSAPSTPPAPTPAAAPNAAAARATSDTPTCDANRVPRHPSAQHTGFLPIHF